MNEQAIGMELVQIMRRDDLTAEEKDAEVERLEAEIERAEQEADPSNGCPPRE